eukprot:6479250-Amphidinium_carterae.1
MAEHNDFARCPDCYFRQTGRLQKCFNYLYLRRQECRPPRNLFKQRVDRVEEVRPEDVPPVEPVLRRSFENSQNAAGEGDYFGTGMLVKGDADVLVRSSRLRSKTDSLPSDYQKSRTSRGYRDMAQNVASTSIVLIKATSRLISRYTPL